jgi:hypothetical protein
MNSRAAALVGIINMALGSDLKGCSVPPVPTNAIFPYITIQDITGKELESMTGPSGLLRSVVQINCWSKVYEDAWNTREAVKSFLLTFTGTAGDKNIQAVNHATDREFLDGVRELHQCVCSFLIWWES